MSSLNESPIADVSPKPWPRRVAGALVVFGALALARQPRLSADERGELAKRFCFEDAPLDHFAQLRDAQRRPVHPDFAHIDGWISAVGGSVALGDFDGDGAANDVAYVDTESDRVIVAPALAGDARFEPFLLDAAELGFERRRMAPMGVLPIDLDENGRMDFVVYFWGRGPAAFLARADAAGFDAGAFVARDLVSRECVWNTNALCGADVDGDGHVDLVVGNYFPDELWVLDPNARSQARMQASMSRAYNGGRNRVLRFVSAGLDQLGAPQVNLEPVELGLAEPLENAWTLAIGACDLDGDQRPELYFANDFGPDQLLHNRSRPGALEFALIKGDRTLTAPHSTVLGADSFKGMGVDFADLDGDGEFDIHVANITTEFGLQESNFAFLSNGERRDFSAGCAPFVERSDELGLARSGWTWDVRMADFDNDGGLEVVHATGFLRGEVDRWPELHEAAMGSDLLLPRSRSWHRFSATDDLSGAARTPFFVRSSSGRYFDLGQDVGLGAVRVTRGVATADLDADGDLDLAIAGQWTSGSIHRNVCANSNAMLGLVVRFAREPQATAVRVVEGLPSAGAPVANVIGAIARVRTPDGRRLIDVLECGNGHSGANSQDLHFGLGALASDAPLQVRLEWRSRAGERCSASFDTTPGWRTVWIDPQARVVDGGGGS